MLAKLAHLCTTNTVIPNLCTQFASHCGPILMLYFTVYSHFIPSFENNVLVLSLEYLTDSSNIREGRSLLFTNDRLKMAQGLGFVPSCVLQPAAPKLPNTVCDRMELVNSSIQTFLNPLNKLIHFTHQAEVCNCASRNHTNNHCTCRPLIDWLYLSELVVNHNDLYTLTAQH